MNDELRAHLELRTQENIRSGMSAEEARVAALRSFGGVELAKENCRDQRGTPWLEQLARDVRLAARQLRKSPGFTAVAVLSLALGIGAGTSVFSVINAILLRALPVPNPQELRVVHWTGLEARPRSISGKTETAGDRTMAESFSPVLFESLRTAGSAYGDVFAFAPLRDAVARAQSTAFAADGMIVSENFFSALGVKPVLGRLFSPGDSAGDTINQAVISYEWWERHYARDPDVIGKALTANGQSLRVAAVLPREFRGIDPGRPPGFFVPLVANSPFAERAVSVADHWWVRLMARLRPGAHEAQLKTTLDTVFAPVAGEFSKQPEIVVKPGGGGLAFDRTAYGRTLWMVLAVVGLVLLLACANLAGLSLSRGAARQHELSVRAALGAGRWRLIRQSFAESGLIAVLGGVLGIAIAFWGRRIIAGFLAQSTEGLRYDLSLDLKVLGFSLAMAAATAILSGLLPALRSGRADPLAGLKSRGALNASRLRTGRVLVVAQVAVSLVLLCGAGLYVRSLANLRQIDAGFDTDRLLVFQLNAGFAGYPEDRISSYYERVQESLARLPGVKGAALTVFPLLDEKSSSGGFRHVSGSPGAMDNTQTHRLVVGETFLETLGIPLLSGRALAASDTPDGVGAIVVNQTFARTHFPNQDPIGHVINTWRKDWRIVGVCGDAKYASIKEPVPPTIYISFRQFPLRFGAYFVVRTTQPPLSIASAVRQATAEIDAAVPAANLTTQTELVDRTISQERLLATLCGSLAGFALALACIGLYGLLAYNVERRRSEIAVRMALGAQPGKVAGGIVRDALSLVIIGLALGLPAAAAATRLIRTQLFGVQPFDPLLIGIVIATLALVTLFSAWLPAARAARVNPNDALRAE